MRIVSEEEFREELLDALSCNDVRLADYVTGPGRSGAIASAYASHILGIPFVPYKSKIPGKRVLIVDTAMESGETMRKAGSFYKDCNPIFAIAFHEPPRVAFWYEAQKPQRYRHELAAKVQQ